MANPARRYSNAGPSRAQRRRSPGGCAPLPALHPRAQARPDPTHAPQGSRSAAGRPRRARPLAGSGPRDPAARPARRGPRPTGRRGPGPRAGTLRCGAPRSVRTPRREPPGPRGVRAPRCQARVSLAVRSAATRNCPASCERVGTRWAPGRAAGFGRGPSGLQLTGRGRSRGQRERHEIKMGSSCSHHSGGGGWLVLCRRQVADVPRRRSGAPCQAPRRPPCPLFSLEQAF